MIKTNKEIARSLENEAVIKAWDEGKDDSDPDSKIVRCEDCHFRNWNCFLKQNEVCCNMSGLITNCDDFCSYGARYNIDEEQRNR